MPPDPPSLFQTSFEKDVSTYRFILLAINKSRIEFLNTAFYVEYVIDVFKDILVSALLKHRRTFFEKKCF